MKKIALFVLAVIIITSCQKNRTAKTCPAMNSANVPAKVKESFNKKYPGVTGEKWFNKDNKAYAVSFKQNNITPTVAQFDNDGNFEQEGDNQNGENNNNQEDNDKGCKCQISEDDKD